MKKVLLTIISILILLSCGKKDDNQKASSNLNIAKTDSSLNTPVAETITGPKIRLTYKLKMGNKFTYRLKTIADNKEEIILDSTMTNNVKQTATYKIGFKVKNVSIENETTELEAVIKSIVAETSMNGQTVKYDSKYIYSTREKVQFVDYEAIKKVPFRVHVNSIGQVVKVDRVNKIMRNILQIQQVPDTLSKETKDRFRINITNGTLMPLVQQVFKVLSEDEVGVGSFWELKHTSPLAIFQAENIATFKISDINFNDKDTTVNIASALSIKVSGNNTVSDKGVTYVFGQPNLSGSGSVIFNQGKGLVKKSESKIIVKMAMSMQGLDKDGKQINSNKKDFSTNINIVELL
ncbi:MAG: hypothetical protein GY936_18865 [Ignavibacteriae bacterium]|nr:hypothetical protein [Ignavibacteriota bacterium]